MSPKIGISAEEIVATLKTLAAVNPLSNPPAIKDEGHPRVILYRYDNAPNPQSDAFQQAVQGGELPLHDVCRKLDVDLQLIELGHGIPSETDNARACAFGMMAAEDHTNILVLAAFGDGSNTHAKASDNFFKNTSPEIAAMFGAMVAGACAGIPVIAEGSQALAAARALHALRPDMCGTLFICGVPQDTRDDRFTIYADEQYDEPGYAGAMLAAFFVSEHLKKVA